MPGLWMVVSVIVAAVMVLVWLVMRVVVGGGIVVRLARWVVVLVGMLELPVAVGMGVVDCRHQSQGTGLWAGVLQPFRGANGGAHRRDAIPS